MGKRADDLLDVFRLGSAESGASRPRARGGKRRGKGRAKARAEGVFLAPRQVVLLSSTVVLLVVLAFTAGLGYGRRDGRDVALRRDAAAASAVWWIRGRLPSVDSLTGERVAPEAVVRELASRYGIPEANIRVVAEDGQRLAVFLGHFQTEARAQAYFREKRLDVLRLRWGSPFYRVAFQQGSLDPGR